MGERRSWGCWLAPGWRAIEALGATVEAGGADDGEKGAEDVERDGVFGAFGGVDAVGEAGRRGTGGFGELKVGLVLKGLLKRFEGLSKGRAAHPAT